jgi:UDP-N-acetylglucosamine 2-epimerase (non-hydrolysing)
MLGTPCVTVRRNTERWVTLEVGANRLVDAERGAIVSGIQEALAGKPKWPRPVRWDISVSQRVVKALLGGIPPLEGCPETQPEAGS